MAIRREGKMIKCICDVCKTAEVPMSAPKILYGGKLAWEICDACMPKLKELLGPGREIRDPLQRLTHPKFKC